MKFSKLILALLVIALFSCTNDDDNGPIINDDVIHYDGENQTGPLLAAGSYEAAAYFPPSELADVVGRRLREVSWFMGIAPADCRVRVYAEGSAGEPGNLLYDTNVTNSLRTPNWNTHRLSSPIEITGEGLWLSIAFTHDETQQSIGCDAGPNNTNGDWLYSSADNSWQFYKDRTPESINWNIRGNLE